MGGRLSWVFLTSALCVALTGPAVRLVGAAEVEISRTAQGQRPVDVMVSKLRIALSKSKIYSFGHPFRDVLVGSSEIVDVVPVNAQEIYVLGKKLGTTNISILDREKNLIGIIDVEVGLDTTDLADKIFAAVGSRDLRVSTRGNKIVLSGTALDATTVTRAVNIAAELAPEGGGVINSVRIASPQQVLLEVRMLEVSREAGRELGIRWEMLGSKLKGRTGAIGTSEILNHRIESTVTAGTPLSIATSAISGNPQFGHMIANLINTGSFKLDAYISALETRGLVRRLAEPNLLALSGDSATFLAGGEIPVPIPGTASTAPSIEYKPFGVQLSFTPTVLGNGLINLRLQPEVSQLDPANSVTISGTTVPGFVTRRSKTTVELRDGQSFAIAGLMQTISETDIQQFPWLGSAPVIGALFRSTAFQKKESELVVIVTPQLVKPAKPGAIMDSPLNTKVPSNDVDLFLMGKMDRSKPRVAVVDQYIPPGGTIFGPQGHILTMPATIVPTRPGTVGALSPAPPNLETQAVQVRN